MKILIYSIILAVFLSMLVGCKSNTVYVPVESVKTEYKDRLIKDSIYVLDSVIIAKNGDTVIISKYKYIYKNKLVRDTVNTTDSIRVPYPVITTIEVNRLKDWQIVLMILGGVFICCIGLLIIRKVKG